MNLPTKSNTIACVFGPFRMTDVELCQDNDRVQIGRMPFRILRHLVAATRDRWVSRRELEALLWGEDRTYVVPNALNAHIHRLRIALGDSDRHPIFIEHRKNLGWRFMSPVKEAIEPVGLRIQDKAVVRRSVPVGQQISESGSTRANVYIEGGSDIVAVFNVPRWVLTFD